MSPRWRNWNSYRRYSMERAKHYAVDCIVLETKGRNELVIHVMNDINRWPHCPSEFCFACAIGLRRLWRIAANREKLNWYRPTKDSHMKTNLVHMLYQVQKYSELPIEKFKEMLQPSELKRCEVHKTRNTWYKMPLEVFTSFIFRVRLV